MTIGQRIRAKREASGINQTDFAKTVGISKQTLYKYENDIITNIPSDVIEKIAFYLHCSPSFLMGWTDDPYPSQVGSSKTVESYLNEPIIDVFERKGIKPEQMKDAYQFIEQFLNLPPEKQEVVENLVKLSQSDP